MTKILGTTTAKRVARECAFDMKIGRTSLNCLATVLLLSWCAANASAAQITISGDGDYRAGSGGEFNVRAADASGAALLATADLGSYTTLNGTVVGTANGTRMNAGFGGQIGFETFCLEVNQFISLPGTYDASISLGARPGGVGGNGTIDLISIGTAYLYSQFAAGSLAGYTYVNGGSRSASAVMLQTAIWFLEDEISLSAAQIAANVFLSGASGAITLYGTPTGVGVGGARADNNVFDVAALNLGGPPGFDKQDQLILFDNNFHVPDGGVTVMLLGMVLTGLRLMRRKLA